MYCADIQGGIDDKKPPPHPIGLQVTGVQHEKETTDFGLRNYRFGLFWIIKPISIFSK